MYSIYSSIHQSINQLVSVLKYALWSIIYYALFIIHCVLCLLSIDNYVSFGIYYIYCWLPIRIFINYHLSLYSIIIVPYLYLMSADSFIFICRAPCQDFCSKLWRKALPKDVRWGKDVASPLQGGRRPAKRSSVLRLNLSLEDTSIGQNWTAWRMTKMEQTCFVLHLKALSLLTLKRSNCNSNPSNLEMQEPHGDPKCLSFRLPSIQVEVHTLRHLTTLSQLKALWHEEGTTGLCQRHSRSFSLTSHCLKRAWERLMFNGFNDYGMATLQENGRRNGRDCEALWNCSRVAWRWASSNLLTGIVKSRLDWKRVALHYVGPWYMVRGAGPGVKYREKHMLHWYTLIINH